MTKDKKILEKGDGKERERDKEPRWLKTWRDRDVELGRKKDRNQRKHRGKDSRK
jgi:hypothetical protein